MEWPTIDILSSSDDNDFLTSEDEAYLEHATTTLIVKEIYARAAKASIANILVDHESSGLRARVEAFLEHLRSSDDDTWNTDYRDIAREFTELMVSAKPRSRTLEICRAGLDAVHDLLKYRLPIEKGNNSNSTILAAKDAFVLCQSFETKLYTQSHTGTRAPDIDFRFGLWTKTPKNDEFAESHDYTLYGQAACSSVTAMRNKGQLETSAASLANCTMMNRDLVGRLARKIFVVIGCDHPLSPTRSLLQIPGVIVLGIPSRRKGLEQVKRYATYNTPDDTTFVYPSLSEESNGRDDGNLVLSRGPHVAQWILEYTKEASEQSQTRKDDSEIVLVPMPLPERPTEKAIRWEAASDLIVQRVLTARSDSMKCSVWSYQNSTTCMVVPSASTTKSNDLLQQRPLHEKVIYDLSLKSLLKPVLEDGKKNNSSPNTTSSSSSGGDSSASVLQTSLENPSTIRTVNPNANHDYSIVNGILSNEGPHHVLVEHIRLWRAMVTNFPNDYYRYCDEDDSDEEDEDDDDDPSKNLFVFAPYTPLLSLDSVSGGNSHFLDPVKVFDAGSASSLLCAIGLASLVDPIINRPLPILQEKASRDMVEPSTPFAMFWSGSVHGGIWNCPYTLNSASGTTGYLLGKVYEYYHYYNAAFTSHKAEGESSNEAENVVKTTSDVQQSIVDAVPSSTHQELPSDVQERLEMIANP